MRMKKVEYENIHQYREADQEDGDSYEVRNYYNTMYTISLPEEDECLDLRGERTSCKLLASSDYDDHEDYYDAQPTHCKGLYYDEGNGDQESNWSSMNTTYGFEDTYSYSDECRSRCDHTASGESERTVITHDDWGYSDDEDNGDDDGNCPSSLKKTCCMLVNMADQGSASPMDLYIYNLPYSVTRSIIASMDADKSWEALASEIGYSFEKLKLFEMEYHRFSGSPTKSLLWDWGNSNNTTVKEFYYKLKNINRKREMTILKNYIQSITKDSEESEESSDSSCTLPSATLSSSITAALPRPSQKSKFGNSEKISTAKENSELNFNLSQTLGSKDLPLKSLNSMEKDRQYDDKIIPGQEHTQSMLKSNKGQSKSFPQSMIFSSQSGKQSLGGQSGKLSLGGQSGKLSLGGQSGKQSLQTMKSNSNSSPTESSDSSFVTSSIAKDSKNSSCSSLSSLEELSTGAARMMATQFSHVEVAQSTNNFSAGNLIGEGAFGKVYFSVLRGMKCAIKRLDMDDDEKNTDNQKQMTNEVGSLLKYRHENIVTLYGFAMDGPTLCLIYQHMVNGSLEDRLMCKGGKKPLNWDQRIRITCGAANGLRFLHKMGDVPLIHGDIKSANILIDKYFEARIGDLGQAKHASQGTNTGQITHITRSCANSKMYGTKAYMAPELHRGSTCSMKSDVYAFGVVLLETCTGEKAYDERREPSTCKCITDYFSDISDNLEESEWVEKFRDKRAGKPPSDIVLTILHLAVSCTSSTKPKRPDMDLVVEELEKCQKTWNDVYASIPEISGAATSLNSCHMSHTSDGVSVGDMAGNIAPTKTNQQRNKPRSPMEYLQNEHMALPVPFQIQEMYDKQKNGVKPGNRVTVVPEEVKEQNGMVPSNKVTAVPGEIKEQNVAEESLHKVTAVPGEVKEQNVPEDYLYKSDPKKLAEIEKIDGEINSSEESQLSLVQECDPVKLARLKLFDQKNMISEPAKSVSDNLADEFNEMKVHDTNVPKLKIENALNISVPKSDPRQTGSGDITPDSAICDGKSYNNSMETETCQKLPVLPQLKVNQNHGDDVINVPPNYVKYELSPSDYGTSSYPHLTYLGPQELHRISDASYEINSPNGQNNCTASNGRHSNVCYPCVDSGPRTENGAQSLDSSYFGPGSQETAGDEDTKEGGRNDQLSLVTEDEDGSMKSKMEGLIKAFNEYDGDGLEDDEDGGNEYSEDEHVQNE